MGGGQWSLYYLIKYLNKNTFNPIVLCPGDGEVANKMREAGADVIFFKVRRVRHLSLSTIRFFFQIFLERGIALVHTDSTTETFYAGIAAKIRKIPLVWHVRVSEKKMILDRILSYFSDKLILVAHSLTRRFSWLKWSAKLTVIYNGFDLDEFDKSFGLANLRREFQIPSDAFLIGCIGRIEERKGQLKLLEAIVDINNAYVIFVGDINPSYQKRLSQYAFERGIANRAIFTGHRDNIFELLKQIDILVLPSLKGEGLPRVILEAMAAKKAVIATDDGGNREAVVDGVTGFIVPRGDSFLLAARISELIADREKREKMGIEGRKRVEECFDIKNYVNCVQNVYCELLKIS